MTETPAGLRQCGQAEALVQALAAQRYEVHRPISPQKPRPKQL